MTGREFLNSVNLSVEGSDLRIQLQTDLRYQSLIRCSSQCEVLGYRMSVAPSVPICVRQKEYEKLK
jgi:hypothetical protein